MPEQGQGGGIFARFMRRSEPQSPQETAEPPAALTARRPAPARVESPWLPAGLSSASDDISQRAEQGEPATHPDSPAGSRSPWLPSALASADPDPARSRETGDRAAGEAPVPTWVRIAESAPPPQSPAPSANRASRWLPGGVPDAREAPEQQTETARIERREWLPSPTREDEKTTATATSGPPVPSSWLPPQLAAKAPEQSFARHADDEPASVGRRGRAVEAYCRELFVPSIATGVAHEILDSLTRAIRDDAELLQTVRTAAAERAGTGDRTVHSATPSSLAARANGTIQSQDLAMLESHLATCLACRAAELRAVRADRAFAGVIGLALKTSA